ncbi:hypothetical protein BCR42DRAFT_397709, partial [Absidia repens]
MTTLFELRPDSTFAVNQLPYYQTALPVFYVYLEFITGHTIFGNQTIPTGPNFVTNDTVKQYLGYVELRPFTTKSKTSLVGAFIPNAYGDTYGRNVLAGVNQLSQKIGWTVTDALQSDYIGYYPTALSAFNDLIHQNGTGVIMMGNSDNLLNYMVNVTTTSNTPLAILGFQFGYPDTQPFASAINVNIDFEYLSRSVARDAVDIGIKNPLCFSEQRLFVNDYF